MQNKGLVRILAVCLVLVCAFYLSFSVVTNIQNRKAKEYAEANATSENVYYDSIATKKIWLGYTLKECQEKEINLGLDLKGGMNVTMEVSVPDILDALSGHSTDSLYIKAMAAAREKQKSSGDHFVTLFVQSYKEIGGEGVQLSPIFAFTLQKKLDGNNSNENIEKVLREEVDAGIQNSFNVLRNRIDRFGVVQPNIQQLAQPGRILIELPGVKEPERVRKLLQGSANLEFWETYEAAELMPKLMQLNREYAALAPQEEAVAEEAVAEETKAEAEAAPAVEDNAELAALVESMTTDSTAPAADDAAMLAEYKKNNPLFVLLDSRFAGGPVVGRVHYVDTAKVSAMLTSPAARAILPRDVRFCWTVKSDTVGSPYFRLIALKAQPNGHAVLEGNVITDARAEFSQYSAYAEVSMTMNPDGAKTWQKVTRDNIHRSIAIVLDDYVYSYPTVQNEISGGRSQITGNFTVDEAKDLANTLKSGKMPAPARIIEESVVGPSLGRESIKAGLWSFLLGFVLILIYMLFYYGIIPGLIADFALICNIFLLVGILASFNAVLTLPGIAGIVLTMGMAVDANVLIYERIREELRLGKGMRKAVEDGFKGAISAIVDANVTSFLTGAILAIFGTGPIKGFAVTYMIGIVSSFLTAVFITRMILDGYCKRENAKELTFTTKLMKNAFQNIHFDFVKARKVAYCISGGIIIFALLGLEPHIFGKLNLGIDFTGGRNYVVRFDKNLTDSLAAANDKFSLRQEVYNNLAQFINPQEYSLNVITYGNEANQVRISTNYLIHEETAEADEAVDSLLFEGCKPFLTQEFLQDEAAARHQFSNTEEQIGIVSSQKVGPSIADDIKTNAVWAVLAALVVIFLYILVRFRNFAYSVGAIAALAHDTVIILGLYAILCQIMPFSMEIDQAFIAAILTVIGYSINDTVVIFDRVREYNGLYPKREKKVNINDALNNTLSRTFSTSMSTLVVLVAIFAFGGETIRGFVFALLMGVIVGTYSSLFIASPIAYDIQQALAKRAEKKAALKK